MNDLPPDLPRLRTLETYLELQLQQVREAIQRQERAQAEEEGWTLQRIPSGKGHPLLWLHRTSCHLAKGARLSRQEAVLALGEPGVRVCDGCHADEGLKGS
ncbi:DUF6233 domain-containing protein [Streptomyces sp. URMC 124]|uniref:DUF6233 domain-containing protein n=1 Tax=Streptomyces sp. URMC 124 TaxID=3423405 RepID=UPI003F19E249